MSLIHKGAKVFTVNWLILPLNLLASILIVRSIGAGGKGIFTLLITTASILSLLGELGTPSAAIYFLRKKKYGQRTLIANYLVLVIVFTLLVCFLFFLCKDWFINLFFKDSFFNFGVIWLVLFILLPITMLDRFISAILLGLGSVNLYARLAVGRPFLNLILVFLLVVVLQFGVTGAVVAYIVASIIALAIVLCQMLRSVQEKNREFRFRWDNFSSLAGFGIKSYPGNVGSLMFKRTSNFLVAYFLNVQAVGYYSVAESLYHVVLSIPRAVNTLLLGESAGRKGVDSAQLVVKATRNILWIMLSVVLLLGVVSFWLIPALYGADFSRAVMPMIVLLISALLVGINSSIQTYFLGIGRPAINSILTVIAGLISFILAFFLIPVIGITGMALAILIGSFIGVLLHLFWFRRLSVVPIRISSILLLRRNDILLWKKEIMHILRGFNLIVKKIRKD